MTELQAFDPIDAYKQVSYDLVTLVSIFDQPGCTLTPDEFLNAVGTIGERLRVVSLVMVTGAIATVMDKLPEDAMEMYQQRTELSRLMESPEEQRERMLKTIRTISKNLNPPTSL